MNIDTIHQEFRTPLLGTPVGMRCADRGGVTMGGYLLFLIGILLATSAYDEMRIHILGLRVHACLLPVAFVLPFVIVSRWHLLPGGVLLTMVTFVGMYVFSCLGPGLNINEVIKLVSSMAVIVCIALLVRRPEDLTAGTIGLCSGMAFLAIGGLTTLQEYDVGVRAIGGNKNTYSLFALPSVLLAGQLIIAPKLASSGTKVYLSCCLMLILLALFLSGNRSGWLGCVVIWLMLMKANRIKGILVTATIAAVLVALILEYGSTAIYTENFERMEAGKTADSLRINLIRNGIEIGLEHPLVGISPQKLHGELGRRVFNKGVVEFHSHNVFAETIGGSGMICFAALIGIGWTLCIISPRLPEGQYDKLQFIRARRLMRMMIVVWVARGFFTDEILVSPAFSMGIGICLGLCIVSGMTPRSVGIPLQGITPCEQTELEDVGECYHEHKVYS